MKYFLVFVLSSFLVACSSGGGGGGGGTVTPALPADATTLTTANAGTVSRSAVDNVVLFGAVTDFRPDGETPPSVSETIRSAMGLIFNNNQRTASRTETISCDNGTTITLDFEETNTSASGSATFNNCDVAGIIIAGSFTFTSNFNDSTGAYSDSANGSLTVSGSGQSATIAMNFSETGNEFSGEFSTTISISVSGTPDSNYLLTTTTPISGVGFNVTAGEILVEGAGNTRLRITVTGTNVADVFLDDGSGTFVFHSTITF